MLDSKQCEAFLAVAEVGSFDAAGEHLCITPSAVSLRVQALEKYLGQILIIRGRPCVLTQGANFTPAFTSYKVNGAKSFTRFNGQIF